MYREIDMNSYARRAHFAYFRSLPDPHAGLTADVDVTDVLEVCRRRGIPFYTAYLHIAALAADAIPEMRQRIRGEGIIEYDECPSSHIELREDGTYGYCTLRHHMPLAEYLARAERARAAAKAGTALAEDEDAEGMYFVSCIPWVRYTQFIQPLGNDSNPRFSWGKYERDADGRTRMPFTVVANHALADGIHLGMLFRNLEEQARAFCEEAEELK